MNEEYNKVNVKLLSILAYIGPLFLMGKLSVEKDEPHVKFHTHQGAILFCFVAGAYVVTSLLCWLLSSFPAVQEIFSLLLYVGMTVAWVIMIVMGVIGAARNQQRPLPFVGDFDRLLRK